MTTSEHNRPQITQHNETELQSCYDEGVCPDCGEPIPSDYIGGEDCVNCGHVFYLMDN